MASLPDADKARVRYHLDYPMLTTAVSVVATAVMHSEIRTILEVQMDNVDPAVFTYVTRVLDRLDAIETQMDDALERMQARKADVVELNPNEQGDLLGVYEHWRNRLCNLLAVQVNPFKTEGAARGLNFRR